MEPSQALDPPAGRVLIRPHFPRMGLLLIGIVNAGWLAAVAVQAQSDAAAALRATVTLAVFDLLVATAAWLSRRKNPVLALDGDTLHVNQGGTWAPLRAGSIVGMRVANRAGTPWFAAIVNSTVGEKVRPGEFDSVARPPGADLRVLKLNLRVYDRRKLCEFLTPIVAARPDVALDTSAKRYCGVR